MAGFILRWMVHAVLLVVVAEGIGGTPDRFALNGFGAAMIAVALITAVNLVLQPLGWLIKRAGCLFNVLTLGLFGALVSFVCYAWAFYLAGELLGDSFQVAGFVPAATAAVLMSFGTAILEPLLPKAKDKDREQRRDRR